MCALEAHLMCPICVNALSFQAQTRANLTWPSTLQVIYSARTPGLYQQWFHPTDSTLMSRTSCLCRTRTPQAASAGCAQHPLHADPDLAQESHSSHQAQLEMWVSPTGLHQAVVHVQVWLQILKYFLQYSTWISTLEAQKLCYSLFNTTTLALLHHFTSFWSLLCQT